MKPMKELQEEFQAYMLGNTESIEGSIVDVEEGFAKKRLAIYGNAYHGRLFEILQSDYSILEKLMGAEVFDQIAHDYIAAYPSHHFSVRHFGQHMSEFIEHHEEMSDASLFSEMAQFEWALEFAFDAEDADRIGLSQLQEVPMESWANLHFVFHPSVKALFLKYNIPNIWQAYKSEIAIPSVKKCDESALWLIWRNEIDSYYQSYKKESQMVLTSLLDGSTFADACQILCETVDEETASQIVANIIMDCLNNGLLNNAFVKPLHKYE